MVKGGQQNKTLSYLGVAGFLTEIYGTKGAMEGQKAMDDEALFVSAEHFRRRYDVGTTRLYELIAGGHIVAKKFGRKLLISVASADLYFNSLPDAKLGTGLTKRVRARAAADAATIRETAA